MYPQKNKLTTPLEKLVFYIIQASYIAIESPGWTPVAAWGDFHPITCSRAGDFEELIENEGVRLLNPDLTYD